MTKQINETAPRPVKQDARITEMLERTHRLSTGDTTALRRALGTTLAEAKAPAQAAFFKIAPMGLRKYEEDAFFLAACASCAFQRAISPERDFVSCLKELSRDSEGVERLLMQLLDTPWDADGYIVGKLSRLLRRILNSDMNVKCAALLGDMLRWGAPSRTVQLRWAREFFSNRDNEADAPAQPQVIDVETT